jgi:hypothetical protein
MACAPGCRALPLAAVLLAAVLSARLGAALFTEEEIRPYLELSEAADAAAAARAAAAVASDHGLPSNATDADGGRSGPGRALLQVAPHAADAAIC